MIKALIFDVDGTLLDTERINIVAWKQAGKSLGYTMSQELMIRTRGSSPETTKKLMLEEFGPDFPYDRVRSLRVSLAEERILTDPHLCKKGARAILEYLHRQKIPFAAATTTDQHLTQAHLDAARLAQLLPLRVTGDMVERGKPAPDIYLRAAELLGFDPRDCLAVEDTATGLAAAQAAGMKTVWIPDLNSNPSPGERACFRRYTDLEELLKNLPQLLEERL